MPTRLYLDNAATSYPKPDSVWDAMDRFNREVGANPGRGPYGEAAEAGALVRQCREALAQLFGVRDPDRFVFGLNGTDMLNLAIKGSVGRGDHVITTALDHNSVMRPLNELEARGVIEYTRLPGSPRGELDPARLEPEIRSNTRLIVAVHGSNVTGSLLPIEQLGRIARANGVRFLVDACQTAGCQPLNLSALSVDLLACSGHKGLLGPMGTGVLYVADDVELATVREGGTGSVSADDVQPSFLPDRFEAGTLNAGGIAGLLAGVRFLLEKGVHNVHAHKVKLVATFLEGVRSLPGVLAYGPSDPNRNAGVVSVSLRGLAPDEAARALDERHGIQVRPGLHCAPWAHRTLGTFPQGTVRFSFGYFNSVDQVQTAVRALGELTAA
ncbi:MAG: cysteine desulfurase [Armatimonadetes bacterium CG_4_10_14_3_um_filter_66_18]|nr:aminotransferase class V-fold PLP-dependent enzyme [Armatimonadota bacterium]PIU90812.1 MAG: cysteine desulfurase [Armatimonadetes bacterium CG06_land_8_20_14_3_00_66_21]PIX50138.1 MAG: cysteine desulfurase [Armatimonadetes bacterium CG_4_8_14_3_um_filter_66_20]PIY45251.1 MAG: cysteine desulfurase [Armatimonadetes bacterium CG_4_10_14_3_um_filter_66_18]PIZ45706.1 MAG: cysteine desulfurase [Armatimonadetes bacterium CG_4_10_14_0_8_um_filter_66_14]